MSAADIDKVQQNAADAARLMRGIGNEHRLLVLCRLVVHTELSVGQLLEQHAGISQSSLSQHLARMREDGLLACRKEGHTVYYRIADEKVVMVMQALKQIYCEEPLPDGAAET